MRGATPATNRPAQALLWLASSAAKDKIRLTYYNEICDYPASWLERLVDARLVTPGNVDRRSIHDVMPDDIRSHEWAHFFAGIGGWDYALQLAGWPTTRPVWTGSAPCQPFSVAGKRRGFGDARHLWPEWFRLIRECRPPTIFGEQVASNDGLRWFDAVCADLENEGYAVGAADIPAAGVGAPHVRQRIWFCAMANTDVGKSENRGVQRSRRHMQRSTDADSGAGPWNDFVWIACRDGKSRPTQPKLFPLAHGIPRRMEQLRAYGNAIMPQVAATFIKSVMYV